MIADRGHTGAVPYDPTIYLGSAAHYRYGRPAYAPELEAVLAREAGLDGTGRLLGVVRGRRACMDRPAFWMWAAPLGSLPSASLISSRRRSVWTLPPACWRRAAAP